MKQDGVFNGHLFLYHRVKIHTLKNFGGGFYGYIINLKIDIADIDNAIADLMDEVETANCNVTQGYKMFKRLKELRLERRDKEKELECLYILTEHFDLSAMADECDKSMEALEGFLFEKSEEGEENLVSDMSDAQVDNSGIITNIAV